MRVAFQTLGCRLNQAETDAMVAQVRAAGHAIVSSGDGADVVVVNGCTITDVADADVRKAVRRAARCDPAARIVVTGCYANAQPDRAAALPGVAAVLGNADKPRLVSWLHDGGDAVHVQVSDLVRRRDFVALPAAAPHRRSRALLKVQDGCNYRCAFCIVPQVRGASRSLPPTTVVEQLRRLVDEGVPEIVLTGVHLGTYGRDLRPRRSLTELVAGLLPHLGGARLRLSSIDPHEVDDELVALMAQNTDRICRHLHLPVQSGDPDVLRRMRRGHTVQDFERLVETLVDRVPGIALGTDVIVGFPGESDAAFSRTLALLQRLPLSYHHVFTYSIRQGTAAATMGDRVAAATKAARNRLLRALSHRQRTTFARRFAGTTLDAVVHVRPRRGGEALDAISDNYLRLRWAGPPSAAGLRVRLVVDADGCVGTPVAS